MPKILDKKHWLFTTPIAHRGLFDENYPENTKPAFEEAIKGGFAIEMDVQMTSDGELVVFHDDNIKRLTGKNLDIRDLTLEKVKKLRPNNKEYEILTFKEFLNLVDGKVPVVVEIKTQLNKGIEEKVVNELKNYNGEFTVQSFNPIIVKKVHKLAPEFIVGVITTRENSKLVPFIINFMMHKLWYRLYVDFDYLNMRVMDLEHYSKKKLKKFNLICWTIKNEEDLNIAKSHKINYIFEKPALEFMQNKKHL